jgi:hypothetical protein
LINKYSLEDIEYFLMTSDFSKFMIKFQKIKINNYISSNIEGKITDGDYNNSSKENKIENETDNTIKSQGKLYCIFNYNDSLFNHELFLSISHSLRLNFSWVRPIIFIPLNEFRYFFLNQIPFNLLCKFLNEFSSNLFNNLTELISIDEDEKFLKFFCVQKIEKKFIEVIKRKILLITNKKIIELDEENNEYDNLIIYSISKFEMIDVYPDINTINIFHSNGKNIEYSSYIYLSLCKLINDIYKKDCLVPLTINKK